ncbi:Protein translocase subunit SecD [Desulfamplus magnetovallimortis]|uniref:Protein translocase subunit SecD n=1 Tax=Desulfamplus magnetovallimortis TaxID=1246637 RepID=A0A1W1H625_9BACT|nr:protein translocase subunit SecD [Desulfamplus magnetovallimortis]SLM27907.1 Protein translocase subunit SecD [Desulfamplus magnetovallimortis]
MKKITWRGMSIATVILVALIYVLPTLANNCWPHKKINLGLDLQGGMHLVLEVQTEKAVETTIERTIHEIKQELRKKNIKHLGVSHNSDNSISIQVQNQADLESVNPVIADEFGNFEVSSTQKQGEKRTVVLKLPHAEVVNIKKMATDQALETIRNRIDAFGVSEPDIRLQGENRIQVQLPGIQETQRAKELIGRTARLNFQLVDETGDVKSAETSSPPPGDEILYQIQEDPVTGATSKVPYLIQKRVLLDGSSLTDAKVMIDSQFNEPYVSIEFDRKGARIFEQITGENIKKRLAIVLDKTVYSAPVIQDRIAGGQARITGNFTTEEARDLAIVLRAGALPAPVNIIEERTVGPTLGADSIRMGLLSMVAGGILVIIFMVIYYKGAGVIADIALLVNILLIGGGLAAFQATLTLPGIAGIILTIGMAVDANVIIFERIREELASGKTPAASINAGFDRAALTILDANVTTLIAAVVLFQFGTGPVKGFAVTLGLGIVASLFTALVLSKSIFQSMVSGKKTATLSI